MKITVNNEPFEVSDGITLRAVLNTIPGLPESGFAVAVGSDVVPASEWDTHIVTEGASITIIRAFYGG